LALYGDIEGVGEGGGEGEGEGRWKCRVVVVVVVVVYCMWSAVEVDVSLRDLGDKAGCDKVHCVGARRRFGLVFAHVDVRVCHVPSAKVVH
jgi:hypothetical protein